MVALTVALVSAVSPRHAVHGVCALRSAPPVGPRSEWVSRQRGLTTLSSFRAPSQGRDLTAARGPRAWVAGAGGDERLSIEMTIIHHDQTFYVVPDSARIQGRA